MRSQHLVAAILAASLSIAGTAQARTVNLTKTSLGTVQASATRIDDEYPEVILARCEPGCPNVQITAERYCTDLKCFTRPVVLDAIGSPGIAFIRWTSSACAAQPTVPRCVVTFGLSNAPVAVHAEFRDVEPPSRPVLTTPARQPVRGTVTVTGDAHDNMDVTGMWLYLDGEEIEYDAAAPFEWTLDTREFADGPRRLTARAHDDESNSSLLSSPASLDVDNTAPTVTIDAVPGIDPGTWDASPTLTFVAAGADDVDCSLDAAESSAFWPCASPLTLSSVSEGIHVVRIRAADLAGNETVAAHTFRVDTAAPETSILDGPVEGSRTSAVAARFEFGSEPGASFACRLDGAALADCVSPLRVDGLAAGTHTFEVRAADRVGNADSTPAARTWTVLADLDGDGYDRPQDCDDAAPGINPGARDIPGNRVDEDCKLGPEPLKSMPAQVGLTWRLNGGRLRIVKLQVVSAPRGTAIEVRCRAPRKACPFRTERLTAPRDGTVSLTRLLRGRRLPVKTRLTVILRRAETMGRWVDYTVGDTGPKRVDRCLAPGQADPHPC